VQEYPGGAAANVSVALRRLDIPVSFIGKLGEDAEGVRLLKEFQNERVDISGVIVDPEQFTVKTFIMVDHIGKKRIYIFGGAHPALSISSPNQVNWKKMVDCKIVYIGEVFVEIADLIASYANGLHKKIIYRPGLLLISFNAEKVRKILKNVNLLILNQEGWEAIKTSSDVSPGDLMKHGPDIIVVTKGVEGCEVYTQDKILMMPAYAVETKDTTGGGDAFAAGLICALLDSKNLENCVKYALAVSAISVLEKGARTALPTRLEVNEFLRQQS
jgi:sugar/nucleoside kinase (ribokinase family)